MAPLTNLPLQFQLHPPRRQPLEIQTTPEHEARDHSSRRALFFACQLHGHKFAHFGVMGSHAASYSARHQRRAWRPRSTYVIAFAVPSTRILPPTIASKVVTI